MAKPLRITAALEARGPAGAFVLTDAQVADLGGGKKAFPVTVTIAGTEHALRLARMGGENLIGLSKAARAAAGVEIGSTYAITITTDASERTIAVPADLATALRAAALDARFAALAPSHRKEYVRWIEEAKKEQTRAARIAKAVTMIGEGRTR